MMPKFAIIAMFARIVTSRLNLIDKETAIQNEATTATQNLLLNPKFLSAICSKSFCPVVR